MIWKPKEKTLSEEEAIALARRELKPFWFGSPPLLAGVHVQGQFSAHPLDRVFQNKGWLIFMIDPTNFSGLSRLPVINDWQRRYGMLNFGIIIVLRFPYHDIYNDRKIRETFIRAHQINSIVVVDPDGNLCNALGGTWNSLPRTVLFNRNEFLHEFSGPKCLMGAEVKIQNFLRSSDPGLPLLPPLPLLDPFSYDQSSYEFGKNFKPSQPAKLRIAQLPRIPTVIPEDMLVLTGQWQQDENKILTRDPKAAISFYSPASHVGIVAKFFHKTAENTSFVVEVNGTPTFDDFHGKDLQPPDDDGNTVIKLSQPWFYQFLKNLPPDQRQISLRFPKADQVAIGIYGLRFAEEE